MSESIEASFRTGDSVSYKYNGMRGEVMTVFPDGSLEVRFPSQNKSGSVITVTLSVREVELIAGKSVFA